MNFLFSPYLHILSPRRLKFSSKEDGFLQGVDAVKVSIAAFQAVDLGSILGRRSIFFSMLQLLN